MRTMRAHNAQAMVETVLAVVIISFVFLVLFRLSYMLTGKILLEHAAMRVARARTVGLNDFMCLKAGRVAVIPVAGERLWPTGEDQLDSPEELARIPIYMGTPTEPVARGVLEYEGWKRLGVRPGNGRESTVSLGFTLFSDDAKDGEPSPFDTFRLKGRATTEVNYPFYMNDEGR